MPKDKNVFRGQKGEQETPVEKRKSFHESEILPRGIKQRHCEAYLIFHGLIADIPDGTTHCKAYYAEDESKFYIYNETNEAWEVSAFA